MNLQGGGLKRAIDAHSGLSALIAGQAQVAGVDEVVRAFDALWSGSLSSAAILGNPDTGVTSIGQRIGLIEQIRCVSKLPIVFDAENGGPLNDLPTMVCRLEPLGVSAIVIEDRAGPKSNSYAIAPRDRLAPLADFAKVVACAAAAKTKSSTVVVARLEGLVFGISPKAVAERARDVESAGVGAILIHSKSDSPIQVFETAERYRAAGGALPLVAVPTSYASVTEFELEAAGFSLVVYANQLLRSAMRQMTAVAERILADSSAAGVEPDLMPIQNTLYYFPQVEKTKE